MMLLRLKQVCAAFAVSLAAATCAQAQSSVADFYRGKTIDLIIGYSPGGSYDLYARLVGRFLGDYIPGKPRVVPRNMPGAGSRAAAAWIYNIGPKDGTVIGTGDQSLAVEQAMGDKGLTIDVSRFQYIGNPAVDNNTLAAWAASGIKTIDDAKTREVPTGATGGSTSSQYPKAMNALIGTRFKIITGYPGGNEINLALEKGEVAVRGSNAWGAWKATRADWLRDKKLNILVQIGLHKAPDLPDVPLMMDLATNESDRAVLKLLSASVEVGRPLFVAPGVPAERVKVLRDAFTTMVKDPIFIETAKREGFDINPSTGEDVQRVVQDIIATPKEITARLQQIIGGIEHNTGGR
jgi:tripartite-type tricarboxylate transporter receptor subunit TctC